MIPTYKTSKLGARIHLLGGVTLLCRVTAVSPHVWGGVDRARGRLPLDSGGFPHTHGGGPPTQPLAKPDLRLNCNGEPPKIGA